jgi:hypothetical protein
MWCLSPRCAGHYPSKIVCRLDARLSVYETPTHQDDDLPSNLLFDPYLRNSVISSIKNQWLSISLGGRDR